MDKVEQLFEKIALRNALHEIKGDLTQDKVEKAMLENIKIRTKKTTNIVYPASVVPGVSVGILAGALTKKPVIGAITGLATSAGLVQIQKNHLRNKAKDVLKSPYLGQSIRMQAKQYIRDNA